MQTEGNIEYLAEWVLSANSELVIGLIYKMTQYLNPKQFIYLLLLGDFATKMNFKGEIAYF